MTRNPMAAPNREGYVRLAAVWSKETAADRVSGRYLHAPQSAAAQGRPLALDGPLS